MVRTNGRLNTKRVKSNRKQSQVSVTLETKNTISKANCYRSVSHRLHANIAFKRCCVYTQVLHIDRVGTYLAVSSIFDKYECQTVFYR